MTHPDAFAIGTSLWVTLDGTLYLIGTPTSIRSTIGPSWVVINGQVVNIPKMLRIH